MLRNPYFSQIMEAVDTIIGGIAQDRAKTEAKEFEKEKLQMAHDFDLKLLKENMTGQFNKERDLIKERQRVEKEGLTAHLPTETIEAYPQFKGLGMMTPEAQAKIGTDIAQLEQSKAANTATLEENKRYHREMAGSRQAPADTKLQTKLISEWYDIEPYLQDETGQPLSEERKRLAQALYFSAGGKQLPNGVQVGLKPTAAPVVKPPTPAKLSEKDREVVLKGIVMKLEAIPEFDQYTRLAYTRPTEIAEIAKGNRKDVPQNIKDLADQYMYIKQGGDLTEYLAKHGMGSVTGEQGGGQPTIDLEAASAEDIAAWYKSNPSQENWDKANEVLTRRGLTK